MSFRACVPAAHSLGLRTWAYSTSSWSGQTDRSRDYQDQGFNSNQLTALLYVIFVYRKSIYFMLVHGPLTRYVKLCVAHAPGMPGTFSPPPTSKEGEPLVSDPGVDHGTCVTHVLWCMSGSLTLGGGEKIPGIPGACSTLNFTYMARGPWHIFFFLWTSLSTFRQPICC